MENNIIAITEDYSVKEYFNGDRGKIRDRSGLISWSIYNNNRSDIRNSNRKSFRIWHRDRSKINQCTVSIGISKIGFCNQHKLKNQNQWHYKKKLNYQQRYLCQYHRKCQCTVTKTQGTHKKTENTEAVSTTVTEAFSNNNRNSIIISEKKW